MSGLLDKAKKSAEPTENKPEEEVSESVIDVFPDESNGSGLNGQKLQFQLGSLVVLTVTMVIVFILDNKAILGEFTLDDLFIPGVLISWLLFNALELKEKEFDVKMLGASAGAILLVSGVFAGLALFSSGTVTISNIEYDGDDNEIDLDFYGPKGMDYTIEVLVDGKVAYTHEETINIDKGSHSVNLEEFWNGNAEDMNGKELIEYEVVVTSKGGEDSMKFNDIMNREIDTAFISVLEKYTYENNGDDKVYEGIYVEMIVGIGSPSSSFDFEDGIFTGKEPLPIASDWSAEIRVLGGSVIAEYDLSADEGVANGFGDFSSYWVSLHSDGGILEKGDFYGDDGCYTFEITVTNEHGETLVSDVSKIEFFWDENEASGDSKPAEAC